MSENNTNELEVITTDVSYLIPKIDFDFDQYDEETAEIVRDATSTMCGVDVAKTYIWGEQLLKVKNALARHKYGNFAEWYEKFGLKQRRVYDLIHFYEVILKFSKEYGFVKELPFRMIADIGRIPAEKQEEYIKNAPLQEMTVRENAELIKQIKGEKEYSKELIEEIRKKDQKIRESRESVEQKDKEIAELKNKIQEIKSGNVQPVAEVKTEIIEKEVVPESVQQELKTLRELAKEKNEVPEHILNELSSLRQQLADKEALLNDAKDTVEAIATQTNSKFGTQDVDWNSLGDIVSHFLGGASEYSYMEQAYKGETNKKKEYVKSQVKRIEKWVLQMKQMMNEAPMIGDVIYSDVDFEIKDIREE